MNEWRAAKEVEPHCDIAKGTVTTPEWGKTEVMRFFLEAADRYHSEGGDCWVRVFPHLTIPACGVDHWFPDLLGSVDETRHPWAANTRLTADCFYIIEQLIADGTITDEGSK